MILIVICVVVGLLIGAIGIGGVLLVPALALAADIGVHEAIPACMLAYFATGIVGVVVFARHGSIQWDAVFWLSLGAVPAAYLGSISLLGIPSVVVMLLIAILMIFAGLDAVIKSLASAQTAVRVSKLKVGHLLIIGFITGFGSAITGTGGPLIIVPIIIFLGLPVLTAVGLSQAIQLPISVFASIGNWYADNLNIELALTIAAGMVLGSLVGALLVHRLPIAPIRRFIALLLVLVGAGIGIHQISILSLF